MADGVSPEELVQAAKQSMKKVVPPRSRSAFDLARDHRGRRGSFDEEFLRQQRIAMKKFEAVKRLAKAMAPTANPPQPPASASVPTQVPVAQTVPIVTGATVYSSSLPPIIAHRLPSNLSLDDKLACIKQHQAGAERQGQDVADELSKLYKELW